MRQHLDTVRFLLAEWLLYQAWRLLPSGIEKIEMATFLQHSWIGRIAADAQQRRERAMLQAEWQRKLHER